MKVVELPLDRLQEAPWNSNLMPEDMLARLKESIKSYGIVENLVARKLEDSSYEVLSGNQRLKVLREMRFAHARLLAQALNHIQGEDDLGLRAELLRKVLETVPEAEVVAILPESTDSLKALASIGQGDIAQHLQAWQQAQAARLHHMQFQFTGEELALVEEAVARAVKELKGKADNPNARGRALVVICESYLNSKRLYAAYRRRTS